MTPRETREAKKIRLEDMAKTLNISINDLCDLERAAVRYHNLYNRFLECEEEKSP